jgi:hypothetical protein
MQSASTVYQDLLDREQAQRRALERFLGLTGKISDAFVFDPVTLLPRQRTLAELEAEELQYIREKRWLEAARQRGAARALSEAATPSRLHVSTSPGRSAETPEQRGDRRLARFYALGGRIYKDGDRLLIDGRGKYRGALARLIEEEKAAGRPMWTKKNLSDEIKTAFLRREAAGTPLRIVR